MDVSHLLNPAGEPDGEVRHSDNVETDIAIRSFRATAPSPEDPFPLETRQAWLEELTNDPELNGREADFLDREPVMRVNLGQKIAQLVRSPIKVVQEMDLRILPTKRKYKHTVSFQEYRRHLNSGPAFSVSSSSSPYHTAADTSPVPEITAALRSLPSFRSSASSYHTARTSRTPSTTGSRSDGPCKTDINLLVTNPEQTIINGTLELKKLKRKEVEGTPLDYPPNVGDPLPPAVRELPEATQTLIKRVLAQGIWYGAIEQEMMRSNGDYRLPPVLVGYVVNQFFVRILLLDDTIYIERDGDNSSLVNLEDYLELFKDGRSFPHHLSTMNGARALMEHVFAACKLLELQESALQNDFEKCTPPDSFQATTQIGRTKSDILAAAADLTSVTGEDLHKAEHHESPPSPPDHDASPPSRPTAFLKPIKSDSPPPTFTQAWIAHCELTDIDPPEEPDLADSYERTDTASTISSFEDTEEEEIIEHHAHCELTDIDPPEEPVLGDSYERTDSASTTSSFDYIEEEEITEHHIKALVSRYRFRCLSRDDFAQTLRRMTA